MLARTLGPHGRGIVTEAMLWPTLVLTCLAVVNVPTSTYFTSRQGERGLKACLLVAVATAAVLLALCLAINWIALGRTLEESYASANVYSLILPVTLVANVLAGALLASDRATEFWVTRALPGALTAVLTIVLVLWGALSERTYVTAAVCAGGLTLTWMILRQRSVVLGEVSSDQATVEQVLRYGGSTVLVMLPYQLNMRLDQVMLSVMSTERSLGLFVIASMWSSMLSVIGSGFSTVVLARSSRVEAADQPSTVGLLRKVRMAVILIGVMALIAAATAPIAIPLLYGASFREAVGPALLLCVASIPLYANVVLHELSRGLGLPSVGVVPEIIGLVANGILLVILIPRYGPIGAAVGSLVSYALIAAALGSAIVRRIPGARVGMLLPRAQDVRDLSISIRVIAAEARQRAGLA